MSLSLSLSLYEDESSTNNKKVVKKEKGRAKI